MIVMNTLTNKEKLWDEIIKASEDHDLFLVLICIPNHDQDKILYVPRIAFEENFDDLNEIYDLISCFIKGRHDIDIKIFGQEYFISVCENGLHPFYKPMVDIMNKRVTYVSHPINMKEFPDLYFNALMTIAKKEIDGKTVYCPLSIKELYSESFHNPVKPGKELRLSYTLD